MRRLLTLLILCITTITMHAQMDDKQQIEALYKQMYRAMIAKDIETLGSILDENAALIHMTGTRQPKREYLRAIKDGTLNYYSVEDDEIIIDVDPL